MSTHRKTWVKVGTLTETTLSIQPSNSDFLTSLEGNVKVDVVFNLTALGQGSTVEFNVEEQLDLGFWYETASTSDPASIGHLIAATDAVGLPNANFPFLGKGNIIRFNAVVSNKGTFTADVYALTWDNG